MSTQTLKHRVKEATENHGDNTGVFPWNSVGSKAPVVQDLGFTSAAYFECDPEREY